MVYWIEGPFAYALIGEMDREQLFATAKTIRQQVESSRCCAGDRADCRYRKRRDLTMIELRGSA